MVVRNKKPKLASTALDAIVVALSPALIIGMVSCLVFFLVLAFYQGQYDQRLIYILGLYTVAIVLIARIAIESGRTYAMAFSIPLALATIVAMAKFVTIRGLLEPVAWLINIALLAIAWYLADRITFDCTLLNEREQGVRQGLLQSLGLFKKETAVGNGTQRTKSKDVPSKKKHNPGVWVLYFSLLAFPLFGLGQLVIADVATRDRAFYFLVGYLACGLGLLVTTAFVNMRRYLRQRGVSMPPEMSRAWLGYGIAGIFLILAACMVLPLPGRSLGLIGLPFAFQSPDGLGGNRGGWGNEGSQVNDGKDASTKTDNAAQEQGNAAQPDGKGKPKPSEQAKSDSPQQASESDGSKSEQANKANDNERIAANDDSQADSSKEQDGSSEQSQKQERENANDSSQKQQDADKSEEQASDSDKQAANGQQTKSGGNAADNKQEQSKAESSKQEAGAKTPPKNAPNMQPNSPEWLQPLFGNIGTLVKWITILVLAVIVLVYAVTHYRELAKLWRDLLNMFRMGSKRSSEASETLAANVQGVSQAAKPAFQQFANPFSSSATWKPEKVVEHTFAALEAWAAERGAERKHDQTATEFAAQLSRKSPSLKNHASNAAKMLNEQLFGGWTPKAHDVAPLAELWNVMQNNPRKLET